MIRAIAFASLLLVGCAESTVPPFIEWLPDHTLIAAHRGGAHLGPENTATAVEISQQPGIEAELMEIDVQRSADGVLVVIHDHSVDRISGVGNGCDIEQDTQTETFGSEHVADLTVEELQALDAGFCFEDADGATPFRDSGVVIPTLTEMLAAFPGQRFVVESKDHTVEAAELLLDTISEADAFERTCFLDFDDAFIAALSERAPAEACIAQPSSGIRCWSSSGLVPFGGGGCPDYDLMWMPETNGGFDLKLPRLVQDVQAAGMPVFMWTVNEVPLMDEVLALGVDGVVTDRPDLLRDRIGSFGVGAP